MVFKKSHHFFRGLICVVFLVNIPSPTAACVDGNNIVFDCLNLYVNGDYKANYSISCHQSVLPDLRIQSVSWLHNNKPISKRSKDIIPETVHSNRLVYRHFNTSRHAGSYRYFVNASVYDKSYTLISPSFKVNRYHISKPRLLMHLGAKQLLSRDSPLVVLQCVVEKLWPPQLSPVFSWYRNGIPVKRIRYSRNLQQFPCDGYSSSTDKSEKNNSHMASISRCLYIWSFREDMDGGNYSCKVRRASVQLMSRTRPVYNGSMTDIVFPPTREGPLRAEYVNVQHNKHVFLPCNRAGIMRFDQARWLLNESSPKRHEEIVAALVGARVSKKHKGFLLQLNAKALKIGTSYHLSCYYFANGEATSMKDYVEMRKVTLSVYPRYWTPARCPRREILIHRPGTSLKLDCSPRPMTNARLPFDCPALHNFVPSYSTEWYLNGQRLTPSAEFIMEGAKLQVPHLKERRHTGFYQCRVVTAMGDEQWENSLVLVRSPTPPTFGSVFVSQVSKKYAYVNLSVIGRQLPFCGFVSCTVSRPPAHKLPDSRTTAVRQGKSLAQIQFKFMHLEPYRQYYGKCLFFSQMGLPQTSSGGKSAWVNAPNKTFHFRTRESWPNKQPEFEVVEEYPGGLLIRWHRMHPDDARGRIIRHRVSWQPASQDGPVVNRDLPGSQYEFALNGLQGNVLYEVSVEGGNSVGFPRYTSLAKVWLLGLPLATESRTYSPRSSIIASLNGGAVTSDNRKCKFTISWSINSLALPLVHSWNLTYITGYPFLPPRTQIFSSEINHTVVQLPCLKMNSLDYLVRVATWLEALDLNGRVLDDQVTIFSPYHGAIKQCLQPPRDVSLRCLPGENGMIVQWKRPHGDFKCQQCNIRIRLVPLPRSLYRKHLYITLSTQSNRSSIDANWARISGLNASISYSVSVAYELPPLYSPFSVAATGSPSCRVLAPSLPVPRMHVRRKNQELVRLHIQILTDDQTLGHVRLVAVRLCTADRKPLPNSSPYYAPVDSIEWLRTSGILIRLPVAELRAQPKSIFIQAASCLNEGDCSAWSRAVEAMHGNSTDPGESDPRLFTESSTLKLNHMSLVLIGFALFAAASTLTIIVLVARLRVMKEQLRQYRRPSSTTSSGNNTYIHGKLTVEKEPFVNTNPPSSQTCV